MKIVHIVSKLEGSFPDNDQECKFCIVAVSESEAISIIQTLSEQINVDIPVADILSTICEDGTNFSIVVEK